MQSILAVQVQPDESWEPCIEVHGMHLLGCKRAAIEVGPLPLAGPQGQVCYYSGPQDALYEKLGHAEVVQVQLDGKKTQQEMERFADVSLICRACFILRLMVKVQMAGSFGGRRHFSLLTDRLQLRSICCHADTSCRKIPSLGE